MSAYAAKYSARRGGKASLTGLPSFGAGVTKRALSAHSSMLLSGIATTFQFESIDSLDEMKAMVRDRFRVGSPRESVRALFVNEGHASFRQHPTLPGVEKYIYDINLCSYYIRRWNLSADFDSNGKLAQLYVNGDIAFADGTPKRILPKVH
jgi:hypothetical protein